jgi:hypothetical protein
MNNAAMIDAPATIRTGLLLAALALAPSASCQAQDSSAPSPSLGDVARCTRKAHASADHVTAKQVTDEDVDGPDAGGVWRVELCVQTPCYEFAITLPKSLQWKREASEPRPVYISLPGHEGDRNHAIRVYVAHAIPQTYAYDGGTRIFLQGWFVRPEYFGQAARIVQRHAVLIDGRSTTIAHFIVASGVEKFRGASIVATTGYGELGFACVFREEDAKVAASICDAIVNSAKAPNLQPAPPRYYPNYPGYRPPGYYPRYNPPNDPPDDPPDDPPEDDDPE